jgi:hypothetical protein
MAGTGFINAQLDALASTLATISGLPVTRDPRNIQPGGVLVGAPDLDAFTYKVGRLTVPVLIISSGPGNQDALDQLLGILADVMTKNVAVVRAQPTAVSIGGTDAPAYDVTVELSVVAA